jgi:hypothetical protein
MFSPVLKILYHRYYRKLFPIEGVLWLVPMSAVLLLCRIPRHFVGVASTRAEHLPLSPLCKSIQKHTDKVGMS